ncbi:mechanosensitive ion channel [Brevibacterium litoralis]|uniref:mechanosensitive ion channel n=1 Tax=Brevibacterium litoralis TaxID=3138935 RepID=UPI0032EFD87E
MNDFDWQGILLKVVFAVLILLATWIIASLVSWAVKKVVNRVPALQRQGNDGQTVGASIGKVASLLVWLFGLIAVLQLFSLDQVLAPLQGLLDGIFGFLPNLIGAGFIFFIGLVLAKVVRQLVWALLGPVDVYGWMVKSKLRKPVEPEVAPGQQSVPPQAVAQQENGKLLQLIGNVLFGVIMIVVSISALQVLGIAAISEPASAMLALFLDAIPAIIAAAVLLFIGAVIAKFLGTLLEQILSGLGLDGSVANLNILPEGTRASTVVTRIVQTAIMIFFGIMAANMLGFPEITAILDEVLALGGSVLFGGAIIAAGFLLAKIIGSFITNDVLSKVLRYATIALFIAMGLNYMGLADSIINMAFGAVVIGGALAAALAFGLGGREAAARTLQKLEDKAPAETSASSSTTGTTRTDEDPLTGGHGI